MAAVLQQNEIKTVFRASDPQVTRAFDVPTIARQLRAQYPSGVNTLFVGQASTSGFQTLTTEKGIIAILIGLLLPAVQKIREGANPERRALESMLKPTGTLAIVMADGSVLDAKSGKKVLDCEGYTYLK